MGTGTLCLRLLSKNWRNWLTRGQFLPDHLLLKSIKMPSQQQTQTHQYHPLHLNQNFTSNKTGDNILSFLIIETVNTTEWQVQSYLISFNWFLFLSEPPALPSDLAPIKPDIPRKPTFLKPNKTQGGHQSTPMKGVDTYWFRIRTRYFLIFD